MDPEIKQLLNDNLEYAKENYEILCKVKRYVFIQTVMKFVYIILIIVPIVLSILYLPPLLKQMLGPYQELMKMTPGGSEIDLNNFDIKNVLKQMQK